MPLYLTCPTCGKTVKRAPYWGDRPAHCDYRCKYPIPAPILSDDGLSALIPILNRDNTIKAHVIVDAADAAWVSQWRWGIDAHGYARRDDRTGDKRRTVLLHRELLGLTDGDGIEGDHIDRNVLNCRRSNLRGVTHAGNGQNRNNAGRTSQYRGVAWDKRGQKWRAVASIDGKQKVVGWFSNEVEAAEAARATRLAHMPYAVD